MSINYSYTQLNKLYYYTQAILPLVYEDSLSYYEVLSKIRKYLNDTMSVVNTNSSTIKEVVDTVNGMIDNIDSFNEKFETLESDIDSRFTRLQGELEEQLRDEIEETSTELTEKINREIALITNQVGEIIKAVTELQQKVNESLLELDSYKKEIEKSVANELSRFENKLDLEFIKLQENINLSLQEALEEIVELQNVQATDPIDNVTKPLNQVLEHIYNELNNTTNDYPYAISVDEYYNLDLSVNEYEKLIVNSIPQGLTIYEYLTIIYNVLPEKDPRFLMRDFNTGKKKYYKGVINLNTDLIRMGGCYTAGELDYKRIKCVNFEGITAFNYDWNINHLIR